VGRLGSLGRINGVGGGVVLVVGVWIGAAAYYVIMEDQHDIDGKPI
jgi:hypothetical protein